MSSGQDFTISIIDDHFLVGLEFLEKTRKKLGFLIKIVQNSQCSIKLSVFGLGPKGERLNSFQTQAHIFLFLQKWVVMKMYFPNFSGIGTQVKG